MTRDQQRENPVEALPPFWARVVKYGIAVVSAVFYVTAVLQFDYTPDASYVSFRVASQLAGGEGFAFNPGQPSAGTGGPAWTLLIAAGIRLGLDAPIVGKTFDLVFACLALFAVYFLASLILRDKIAALIAALLFSVDAWALRSSASGLGNSLALLLAVVTLWYGFRREYVLASLVNGFLMLCAPLEAAALFALTMVDAFAFWRRMKAPPAAAIRSLAAISVVVIPWVAYAFMHSIPLGTDPGIVTFSAAPFLGAASQGDLIWYAASGGIMLTALVLGHALAAFRSDWRLLAPSAFPVFWAVAAVALTLALNPEGMVRTWILVAPVIVIYGILGLYYLSAFAIGPGRRSTLALMAAVVASIVANQAVYRLKVVPEMNRTVVEMQEQVRPMAHWVRSRMASDETLVAPFAGMIGWISGVRVLGSPALWVADGESSGGSPAPESLDWRRAAVLVDRSGSGSRLASLGLVPVRSWGAGGGSLYTLYADSARRESMVGVHSGPGAR